MGYLVEDLLSAGHEVIGIDNFSKYGETTRSYDNDPRYKFLAEIAKDVELLKGLLVDCDVIGGRGGENWRHLLFPRVRIRPDRGK